MSNWFCPSRRCLCCMIALRGTFTMFKAKIHVGASALLCVQWQNLDIKNSIWTINVPYERKINMLSCTEISFVISFFNFEKFWVKPGFPFTQLNRANTQNLEENFDMFYKNYCWAVICYPICVTNVSYEREIIVLSFSVINFVILIFVFLRFEIKSGFPFFFFYLLTLHFIAECCIGIGGAIKYKSV